MIYVPKVAGPQPQRAHTLASPAGSRGLAQTDLALACGLCSTQADGPVHSGRQMLSVIYS